jgi:tRNA G18 (ribose-2'-O)-methylase SpoU
LEHKKKDIVELTRISTESYRKIDKLPVAVMADNVRSMMNIGSMFRTADAFLIEKIVLAGISGCPPHAEISKTALGAEKSVKWIYASDALMCAQTMKSEGWKICCLEQTHNSFSLENFSPVKGEKYLIVVGNEVEGVDQRIVDMADYVLEIPQHGTKHSLNVSVSAALAMWEFYKKLI